jgi:DNA (cytosine-5)-methyltransferase 1
MIKPSAYYNEFDPKAAAWLRELIKMGLIMAGYVDERSIIDVEPKDLEGYTRHHFFAGIGGWDYALQLAGWPEDKPVCTASLPCQPFSTAGKRQGKADERHLLPHFLELVRGAGFRTIFGEQVPGAIKHGWLDDLCDEMERENYTVRAAVLAAAGSGAPHIRQRLYWVAHSESQRVRRGSIQRDCTKAGKEVSRRYQDGEFIKLVAGGAVSWMDDPETTQRRRNTGTDIEGRGIEEVGGSSMWANCQWLQCRDGKQRPIKPGIKPVVNGLPGSVGHSRDSCEQINANNTQEARVMRLKGYGNAIVPQVAAEFIRQNLANLEHE